MLIAVSQLISYVLQAEDGELGRCKDFLVDDRGWNISYLVGDTRKWLPGRQVCVSLTCVEWVDRVRDRVGVGLSREMIRNSPEYNPVVPMTEAYQVVLHDYYGWPRYWED